MDTPTGLPQTADRETSGLSFAPAMEEETVVEELPQEEAAASAVPNFTLLCRIGYWS